jgi:glycosyltransferase involved in cell wall biosynthesis
MKINTLSQVLQSIKGHSPKKQAAPPIADIGLMLEGTYPYIRGGVSSWVHQIISSLPEFTFSLVFLGGAKNHYGKMMYTLPPNVVHLEEHFLMDITSGQRPRPCKGNPEAFASMKTMHHQFKSGKPVDIQVLKKVFFELGNEDGVTRESFLFSEEAWNMVSDFYDKFCTEPSFIDYFWSIRTMHAPLFLLAEVARTMPPVRILHSVSTGYAGLQGTILSQLRHCPFILTEHGIYTKERKIDLAQAQWIHDPEDEVSGTLHEEVGYIRQLWIRFFELVGKLTYQSSDPIISLYEGNRTRQINDGAEASKTRVIPNGIALEKFAEVLAKRPPGVPRILGLIGRVVPIKDIKTYIRMMRGVCNVLPDAEGWIVGPEEEDEAYVNECKELVSSLGLQDQVKFLGFQNVADILPQLGLMVLTSISEALPLVILEAYASGLPCLATDVGACSELIYGMNEADKALGAAGVVVPIADPDAAARGALSLLTNEDNWYKAQQAGLARVKTYYTDKMMIDAYRDAYTTALAESDRRLAQGVDVPVLDSRSTEESP